ncbi:MAG: alpha-hydroxy acid oxidase [Pseudochelatococcus sp.]|uniref:alpha-hydroxy acid oxidase n=1 Tax=Pseudochelatococcus sp. TaxID=2020869 RepID=UPI003D8C80E9
MAIAPDIVALDDYERHARGKLEASLWAYLAGGGADGITLRRNRAAFDDILLNGRIFADMRGAGTGLSLFGERLDFPVIVAPTAYHRLVHPQGEIATVRGAGAVGGWMVVSTLASTSLEDVAAAAVRPAWFQLYLHHDPALTIDLVRRAEDAGYRALVVTGDATVAGLRNEAQRAGFRLPPGIAAVNLPPDAMRVFQAPPGESPVFLGMLDKAPRWDAVARLCAATRLPVIVKGVMHPDDAAAALSAGARGIVVSNHGGRTLDGLPATIEVLPHIARRVAGAAPLLLDGGVRRGTDILKALALGADAVLLGRPVLYALAVAGAAGVAHLLTLLRTELEVAMTLTGCATIADIGPGVLAETLSSQRIPRAQAG